MNAREKKLCLLAYQKGVEDEREQVAKQAEIHYRRIHDSPLGMATTWACVYDWNIFEGKV